jgi:excisionase family DNA binding protein
MARPKGKRERHRYSWTEEEEIYLQDQWGITSLDTIAKNLGRTNAATYKRAKDIGLGPALAASGAYTTHQIAGFLGVATSTVFHWVNDGKMKGHRFARENGRFAYRIYEENFLEWLKNNQSKYSSVNIPTYIFADEPQWLREKRKKDAKSPLVAALHWTTKEEAKLIAMVKSGMYTRKEMMIALNRTDKSINSKIIRLRQEGRIPVLDEEEKAKAQKEAIEKVDIRDFDLEKLPNGRWRDSAQLKMAELNGTGLFKYREIGELFGCSGKAVRTIIRKLRDKGICKPNNKLRKSYSVA